MVALSEFKSDSKAIQDGMWVLVNESQYGDLEILSRGFTDQAVDAQAARLEKLARQYQNDQNRIKNAERREMNAALLQEFLILGVRNLTDDDGNAVPLEEFHAMLYRPEYNRLMRACWDAVGLVTNRVEAQAQAALGNLPKLSGSNSNGETSEQG